MIVLRNNLLFLYIFLISSSGTMAAEEDPWQVMNENTYNFNEAMDATIATPLARGYLYVTPEIVQTGVTNFISNVEDVSIGINNILQGHFKLGIMDFTRVIINSSLGIGGLFNVATSFGLEKHDEDFGQTLAVWGVPAGPYIVLPLLGPSTLRDTFGKIPDSFVSPTLALDDDRTSYTYTFIDLVETRARYLGFDSLIIGDKYTFMKNAFYQQRAFDISNGMMKDEFDDSDEFDF